MIRRLTIFLALIVLLLPGCAVSAAAGAAAWKGVKLIAKMVRVVEIIVPDKDEPNDPVEMAKTAP